MNLKQSLTPEQQVEAHKMLAFVQNQFVNKLNRTNFICLNVINYGQVHGLEDIIVEVVEDRIQEHYLNFHYTARVYLAATSGRYESEIEDAQVREFRLAIIEELLKELA
jgi:hypothetical protein